jgi:hypothetical protein
MGQALATSSPSPLPFETDLDGIDKAAQSVLMLDIYDANDDLIATGSGFVAFDNYTMVTNCHVIEGADYIIANSDAGYQYFVTKVIAADAQKDIAILEFFSPTDLTPLTLDATTELRRAESVVAIGSPKAVTNTVSLGNISAMYKNENVNYIQFTAPISHGSSGGALFNSQGNVIGVISAFYTDGQNMNVAVDIGEVMALYDMESGNERVELSGYSAPGAATPTPEPTATPTLKPAATPTERPASTLPEVTGIQVSISEKGVDLTWKAVPRALQYNIYRSLSMDGSYSLLTVVQGNHYCDASVAPGSTYYYRIRSVRGGDQSDLSEVITAAVPVMPTATPYWEPLVPIVIGDDGYIDQNDGVAQLEPKIVNVSKKIAVDSFTLTFYCEDEDNKKLTRNKKGDYYTSRDFEQTIEPDSFIYPGKTVLTGYTGVKYVYVAITQFHTVRGETVKIAEKDWDFWYWTMK